MLAAIQHPAGVVVAAARRRHDALCIRSRFRFGQRVRRQHLAARECRQIARLLVVVAEEHQRLAAESAVHADQHAQRCIDRGHGAEYAGVGAGREAEAAVLRGDGQCQQSGAGEGRDDGFADRFILVHLPRIDQPRRDHLVQRGNEPMHRSRFVRPPQIERGGIGEQQRFGDVAVKETPKK